MKYIPPKYRFFIIRDNKEVEVFPLHDPGNISFTLSKWNDFTDDFKITANDDFIFVDDWSKVNTENKIYRTYQYFETQASALVQSVGIIVKELFNGIYTVKLTGKLKILNSSVSTFDKNKRKFVGKIETTSKHQDIENIFDSEVNILETNISHKRTVTLFTESIDYENTFLLSGVLQHIFDFFDLGITVQSDPYNYITNTLLIENLLIADKTDIKRPNASSNATILNFTLGRLLKIFSDLFNLKYRLTNTNEFYFQHPSEKPVLQNTLTDDQILNFKTITYGYNIYPKSIEFSYQESNTAGFINQLINFNVNEGNQLQKKGEQLNCDLQFIIDNQLKVDSDPDAKDEVNDSGATIIGADSSLNIYEASGVYNSKLQLDFLVENCFYYDLYFDSFTQNNIPVQINSLKKRKKTILSIENFSNFDVNRLISTSFGICEITKISIRGNNLKLDVDY